MSFYKNLFEKFKIKNLKINLLKNIFTICLFVNSCNKKSIKVGMINDLDIEDYYEYYYNMEDSFIYRNIVHNSLKDPNVIRTKIRFNKNLYELNKKFDIYFFHLKINK
ncbi:MAG: hypothetical protein GY830_06685 [Bacteroidetes bacterium]|nr:hypothetical protein [Bacteroidota bacterium]